MYLYSTEAIVIKVTVANSGNQNPHQAGHALCVIQGYCIQAIRILTRQVMHLSLDLASVQWSGSLTIIQLQGIQTEVIVTQVIGSDM